MSSLIYHTSQDSTGSCLYDLQDTALRYLQVRVHLLGSCGLPLYNSTCSRVQAPFFGQQHISPRVFHSLMAPPTPGDFERCSELRQWYKNHSDECPCRNSDDNTEATLATWLDKARSRRARAHDDTASGRKLNASETAQLNNIMATQRPKSKIVATQPPKPSSSKRYRQKSTKDEIDRCNQLKNWYINHSGQRPRQSSDDKTEASLALWLKRALFRRTRAVNNRPCLRQLTTKETARLNSILTLQKKTIRVYKSKTDLERCNELRQWCLSHSGQLPTYRRSLRKWYLSHPGVRPRRRSDDKKQTALAIWLGCARIRRARAINKWPSGRQLTAKETAQLNSILASASAAGERSRRA